MIIHFNFLIIFLAIDQFETMYEKYGGLVYKKPWRRTKKQHQWTIHVICKREKNKNPSELIGFSQSEVLILSNQATDNMLTPAVRTFVFNEARVTEKSVFEKKLIFKTET